MQTGGASRLAPPFQAGTLSSITRREPRTSRITSIGQVPDTVDVSGDDAQGFQAHDFVVIDGAGEDPIAPSPATQPGSPPCQSSLGGEGVEVAPPPEPPGDPTKSTVWVIFGNCIRQEILLMQKHLDSETLFELIGGEYNPSAEDVKQALRRHCATQVEGFTAPYFAAVHAAFDQAELVCEGSTVESTGETVHHVIVYVEESVLGEAALFPANDGPHVLSAYSNVDAGMLIAQTRPEFGATVTTLAARGFEHYAEVEYAPPPEPQTPQAQPDQPAPQSPPDQPPDEPVQSPVVTEPDVFRTPSGLDDPVGCTFAHHFLINKGEVLMIANSNYEVGEKSLYQPLLFPVKTGESVRKNWFDALGTLLSYVPAVVELELRTLLEEAVTITLDHDLRNPAPPPPYEIHTDKFIGWKSQEVLPPPYRAAFFATDITVEVFRGKGAPLVEADYSYDGYTWVPWNEAFLHLKRWLQPACVPVAQQVVSAAFDRRVRSNTLERVPWSPTVAREAGDAAPHQLFLLMAERDAKLPSVTPWRKIVVLEGPEIMDLVSSSFTSLDQGRTASCAKRLIFEQMMVTPAGSNDELMRQVTDACEREECSVTSTLQDSNGEAYRATVLVVDATGLIPCIRPQALAMQNGIRLPCRDIPEVLAYMRGPRPQVCESVVLALQKSGHALNEQAAAYDDAAKHGQQGGTCACDKCHNNAVSGSAYCSSCHSALNKKVNSCRCSCPGCHRRDGVDGHGQPLDGPMLGEAFQGGAGRPPDTSDQSPTKPPEPKEGLAGGSLPRPAGGEAAPGKQAPQFRSPEPAGSFPGRAPVEHKIGTASNSASPGAFPDAGTEEKATPDWVKQQQRDQYQYRSADDYCEPYPVPKDGQRPAPGYKPWEPEVKGPAWMGPLPPKAKAQAKGEPGSSGAQVGPFAGEGPPVKQQGDGAYLGRGFKAGDQPPGPRKFTAAGGPPPDPPKVTRHCKGSPDPRKWHHADAALIAVCAMCELFFCPQHACSTDPSQCESCEREAAITDGYERGERFGGETTAELQDRITRMRTLLEHRQIQESQQRSYNPDSQRLPKKDQVFPRRINGPGQPAPGHLDAWPRLPMFPNPSRDPFQQGLGGGDGARTTDGYVPPRDPPPLPWRRAGGGGGPPGGDPGGGDDGGGGGDDDDHDSRSPSNVGRKYEERVESSDTALKDMKGSEVLELLGHVVPALRGWGVQGFKDKDGDEKCLITSSSTLKCKTQPTASSDGATGCWDNMTGLCNWFNDLEHWFNFWLPQSGSELLHKFIAMAEWMHRQRLAMVRCRPEQITQQMRDNLEITQDWYPEKAFTKAQKEFFRQFWVLLSPAIQPSIISHMNTFRKTFVWRGHHHLLAMLYCTIQKFTISTPKHFDQLEEMVRRPRARTALGLEEWKYGLDRVMEYGEIYKREIIKSLDRLARAWKAQGVVGEEGTYYLTKRIMEDQLDLMIDPEENWDTAMSLVQYMKDLADHHGASGHAAGSGGQKGFFAMMAVVEDDLRSQGVDVDHPDNYLLEPDADATEQEPFVDPVVLVARAYAAKGKGKGSNFKPGDWYCSKPDCKAHNFARRTECFKCKAPKPPEGKVMLVQGTPAALATPQGMSAAGGSCFQGALGPAPGGDDDDYDWIDWDETKEGSWSLQYTWEQAAKDRPFCLAALRKRGFGRQRKGKGKGKKNKKSGFKSKTMYFRKKKTPNKGGGKGRRQKRRRIRTPQGGKAKGGGKGRGRGKGGRRRTYMPRAHAATDWGDDDEEYFTQDDNQYEWVEVTVDEEDWLSYQPPQWVLNEFANELNQDEDVQPPPPQVPVAAVVQQPGAPVAPAQGEGQQVPAPDGAQGPR